MDESSRKSWRVPIIIGLMLLAGVIAVLFHRSSSQGKLRRYMTELRANGEKLTFAELTINRGADNNSSKVFFRATAQLKTTALAPYTMSPRDFVNPGRAQARWREPVPAPDQEIYPLPARPAGSGPVTWAQLRAQFDSNQVALGEIKEAMRNPSLSSGTVPTAGGPPVNNYVSMRIAAQWLAAATILDLHDGRNEEAMSDLEALGGMTRWNSEDLQLVGQMIHVAIGSLGLATTWELLQRADVSEVQLQRVAAIWQQVDFLDGLERALVGERALGNQFWSKIQTSSAAQMRALLNPGSPGKRPFEAIVEDFIALPAYRLTSVDDDHLFYLHCMQDNLDATRAVRRQQAWLKAKPALDNTFAQISRIAGTPERYKYCITMFAMPNIAKATETVVRTETERRMTLAAIALQRYHLRFGTFPEKLEALIPEFLPATPIDCMNGQPLSYHLNTDGSYTLYSVGSDGRDDGGDASAPQKTNPNLWSGKDAVWPSAVSSANSANIP